MIRLFAYIYLVCGRLNFQVPQTGSHFVRKKIYTYRSQTKKHTRYKNTETLNKIYCYNGSKFGNVALKYLYFKFHRTINRKTFLLNCFK